MIGLLLRSSPPAADHTELAQLQQQVAILNRNLVLDRLENDSPSKRLLGVIEASDLAEHDPEVRRALLDRAVDDRVHSVRSAAIDAIGPRLGTPAVGDELMASLEKAKSPLVQLALADLVLRYGNPTAAGTAGAAQRARQSASRRRTSTSNRPYRGIVYENASRRGIGLLALLAFGTAAAAVTDQKTWSQTYPVTASVPRLLIDNVWGNVRVRTGTAREIAVTVDEKRSAPTPGAVRALEADDLSRRAGRRQWRRRWSSASPSA